MSWQPRPRPGARVYAVGDIHGMAEPMAAVVAGICEDLRARPPQGPVTVVFLGDYVDRGPDSAAVLRRLADLRIDGAGVVCLKGNHEEAMLRFLADPVTAWPSWLTFGGDTTLASFGVSAPRLRTDRAGILAAHAAFRDRLGEALVVFVEHLAHYHVEGDYLFVHAGIRPGVPLAEQDPRDLLWIRDGFLSHTGRFSHFVVHGHTPAPAPAVAPNRIGIDTGVYMTGTLTCLVLEDGGRWIIDSDRPEPRPI